MNFKRKIPEQPGYYWFIDIEYPDPSVIFYYNNTVYPTCGGSFDVRLYDRYRFGDMIDKPACADNTIEK